MDNRTIPRFFCRNLTDFCLEKVSTDMKVDEWTSEDVHTSGGGEFPPCAGLTSNALPEAQSTVSAESSQTGVSTRSVHILSKSKVQNEEEIPHWYALRTTYGREKKHTTT